MRGVNAQEARKGHQSTAVTPRHFLDFINHYSECVSDAAHWQRLHALVRLAAKLFHEKREALEDEQRHLDVGLQKIGETEEQVTELQKSLKIKDEELKEKRDAANAKLQQMMANQKKAEDEEALSVRLRKELEADVAELEKKKAEVSKELAQVEPAVEDAKQSVKGIKKQQLSELRSMTSPPNPVKLALESICTLLGEDPNIDWKGIRQVMVKDDFITRILQFDSENVPPHIAAACEKYLKNPEFHYDKVRARIARNNAC